MASHSTVLNNNIFQRCAWEQSNLRLQPSPRTWHVPAEANLRMSSRRRRQLCLSATSLAEQPSAALPPYRVCANVMNGLDTKLWSMVFEPALVLKKRRLRYRGGIQLPALCCHLLTS